MKGHKSTLVRETFFGYIETTRDSLLLFEACKRGLLPRITRRLQDSERILMIKSGAIFCFDEKESGIKRWTDGLVWSPSRIMGNFLVYRELESKKHQQLLHGSNNKQLGKEAVTEEENDDEIDYFNYHIMKNKENNSSNIKPSNEDEAQHPHEKAIVGSLRTSHCSSYKFKRYGLIKKSISLIVDGVQQHIISYYNKEDVLSCKFATPSSILELSTLKVSPGLRLKQNLRIPVFIDHQQAVEEDTLSLVKRKHQYRKRKYSDVINEFEQQQQRRHNSYHYHYPTYQSIEKQNNKRLLLTHPDLSHRFSSQMPMTDHHSSAITPTTTMSVTPNTQHQQTIPEPSISSNQFYYPSASIHHMTSSQQQIYDIGQQASSVSNTESSVFDTVANSISSATKCLAMEQQQQALPHTVDTSSNSESSLTSCDLNSTDTTTTAAITTTRKAELPASSAASGYGSGPYHHPILSSVEEDFRQGQNPHQHLFFSNSFHSMNNASLSNNGHFHLVSANAHMADMNLLLKAGWNEFEIQL
ncbi:Gti1/Pac2 family-domain-containing protein [Mycotypha africana]|uniref:Gti1/Pac2 family-domain-containing protein n=1 Tax=Mycotypha africana TaxID=64632 RepID=UPI002300DFEB|nr:Gti1/Pac2 family-domain-containing protein [Mycotypha africana]KAI8966935.1 Gti1/Pac2 family-domain-containing protein [Mycotypha africana]